jgi:hypothetical protein
MAIKQETINSAAGLELLPEFVEVENERFAKRRYCDVPATLFLPDRDTTISCRVCDMSATGAGVVVTADQLGGRFSGRTLPDRFWLRLPHDGSEVCCRVAWQMRDRYGLRFVSPMQPMMRPRRMKAKTTQKKSSLLGLVRA